MDKILEILPRNFDGHFQSLVGLLDLTEVAESRRFEAVRVRFIRANRMSQSAASSAA